MADVYFKKLEDFNDTDLINKITYQMLEELEKEIKLESKTPLKVHFGEKGNDTFIKPNNYEGVRKFLKDRNIESCYIDSNVLYKGSRTITEDHIKTAQEHGFNDLEIVIADSDTDNPYNEIEVNLKNFKTCKISSKYNDYNNFIVLSHFKGHGLAGFGGAIKQLAMGFASRGGKLAQHSDTTPIINTNKCISCGACVNICPVSAISLNPKASIDKNICIGCARCTISCPVNAINNGIDAVNFYEKLAEYAYAATINKNNIYITFAFNITNECDCVGNHMEIIAPNIGIFASTDPVAIDKAALDKFHETSNNHNFDGAINTLNYAEEIGLGKNDYNLIEL